MKFKVTAFVLALSLLLATNTVQAMQFQATPMGEIDCDGNGIVWASYMNKNWDIFYANISTNQQSQITTDTFNQVNPSINGEKIVWQDDRDGNQQIYLMNLNSKSQEKISSLPGDNVEPIIRDNFVIWINENNGYRNLVVYDLPLKTEKMVTDKISIYGLDFDGEYAVWTDSRKGNFDINMYDLKNNKEERITYYSGDELNPRVSDGKIVYSLEYEGTRHIHQYDILMQEESKITAGELNHDILAFSNEQMIMTEGNTVFLKDTLTTVGKRIAPVNNDIPESAFLFGENVVWINQKGMETENIGTALKRAEAAPINSNSPGSSASANSNSSGTLPANVKSVEHIIKAAKGKDINFDLESGKLRLYINGANVISDGEIKLIEIDQQINTDGYTTVSKTYQLVAPANIVKNNSAQLIVSCSNYAEGIRIYQVDGNPKALKIIRDKGNNNISAAINNNSKVSAMIFTKQYSDIMNHWAKKYMEEAAAQQIIKGYADGTIKPNNKITRAEFVKILVNSFAGENQSSANSNGFTDSIGHWAEKDLKIAQEKGWLKGYDGKALPDSQITREEMMTILMRISENDMKNSDTVITQFTDHSAISDWSKGYIQRAVTEGIIQGSDGKLNPKANATRAESITMIYKYLNNRSMM